MMVLQQIHNNEKNDKITRLGLLNCFTVYHNGFSRFVLQLYAFTFARAIHVLGQKWSILQQPHQSHFFFPSTTILNLQKINPTNNTIDTNHCIFSILLLHIPLSILQRPLTRTKLANKEEEQQQTKQLVTTTATTPTTRTKHANRWCFFG